MVRSQKRGTGNSPKDEMWIEWMQQHGGLTPIDPDEAGLPWPAMQQWDGDADNEGNPWMVPPPHKSCRGKAYVRDADGNYIMDRNGKRIMRPCWNWPMKGTTVCIYHGGGVEKVRKGAMERLIGALDYTTAELIRLALSKKTDDKVKIQAINSILDRT
ncbi:MAG TPA: hypothetical protein VF202_15555, partial [Trueperaceae bacterium]